MKRRLRQTGAPDPGPPRDVRAASAVSADLSAEARATPPATPGRDEVAVAPRFGARVRRAYLIGLGLIAVLSIGSFLLVDDMVEAQEHSAAVINVAGRQRMLSQRVARLSHSVFSLGSRTYLSQGRRETLDAELHLLATGIEEMEVAHEGLIHGNPERGLPGVSSPKERQLYQSGPHLVDARVRSHIKDARRVLADPGAFTSFLAVQRMSEAADEPLLKALDTVVQFHEGQAHAHTALMRRVHLVILAVTLLALAIEALVIFRPLVRLLERTERTLAGRKAELWHQSRHDHLTGLLNRRALREALEGEAPPAGPATGQPGPPDGEAAGRTGTHASLADGTSRLDGPGLADGPDLADGPRGEGAGPFGGPFAVLAIDLDNFKRLNDTVGHKAGDDLLGSVGRAIAREVRDGDLAVRLGGDEFVVIVPLPPDGGAEAPGGAWDPASIVAERLCGALRRAITADPRAAFVSASIGVAVSPRDGESFDVVMANADIALYHAKAAGRDRWARFEPAMREAHRVRDVAEAMLRDGLARDAFEPHFQPQVNLRTGGTVAVEALARLIDEDGRPVPPGAFLPAAEATGLIVPVGRRVIERAVAAAAAWERGGITFGRLSVNASAAQLRDPDFAPFLGRILREHALPPHRLAVEVLETVILDRDGEEIVATCRAIRDLGIAIELDDFGTGYASIANVEALGVERIKIDRSILAAAPRAERDVLRAIVTLAAGLGLGVVAEGVESAEDGARLLALGCPEAQGYHLARPMPRNAMEDWLRERAGEEGVKEEGVREDGVRAA